MRPKALVFHPVQRDRTRVAEALRDHFAVTQVDSAKQLVERISRTRAPQVVLAELLLPQRRGIELIRLISRYCERIPIIVVSPLGAPAVAVATTKAGAFGFVGPADGPEEILSLAYDAVEHGGAQASAHETKGDITMPGPPCPRNAAGGHCALASACRSVPEVQCFKLTDPQKLDGGRHFVLAGETGTGRKTIARFLHTSLPHTGVMQLLDCNRLRGHALPAGLGTPDPSQSSTDDSSFTNNTLCISNAEQMHDETLDQLASLSAHPVRVQLATGREILMRYRIIAIATSTDAPGADESTARLSDAFDATVVHMPPLRRRMEDLPEICEQLMDRLSRQHGMSPKAISAGAMEVLSSYGWPGNITELANFIERQMLVNPEPTISEEMVPMEIHIGGWKKGATHKQLMENIERQLFTRVLARVGGCRRRAADRLQLPYSTLKFRLRKLSPGPK